MKDELDFPDDANNNFDGPLVAKEDDHNNTRRGIVFSGRRKVFSSSSSSSSRGSSTITSQRTNSHQQQAPSLCCLAAHSQRSSSSTSPLSKGSSTSLLSSQESSKEQQQQPKRRPPPPLLLGMGTSKRQRQKLAAAARRQQQRLPPLRAMSCIREDDDEVSSVASTVTTNTATTQKKKTSARSNNSPLKKKRQRLTTPFVPFRPTNTTTSTTMLTTKTIETAITDGHSQFLHDECLFVCSSLLSKNNNNTLWHRLAHLLLDRKTLLLQKKEIMQAVVQVLGTATATACTAPCWIAITRHIQLYDDDDFDETELLDCLWQTVLADPMTSTSTTPVDNATQDSQTSVESSDAGSVGSTSHHNPTLQGRRRRKKKRQQDDEDALSFESDRGQSSDNDSTSGSIAMDKLGAKLCKELKEQEKDNKQGGANTFFTVQSSHSCESDAQQRILESVVPVWSLVEILRALLEGSSGNNKQQPMHPLDDEEDDDTSGCTEPTKTIKVPWIPQLGQALGDTLAALLEPPACAACVSILEQRFIALASLVESVDHEARPALCRQGYTTPAQGYLLVGMATLLHRQQLPQQVTVALVEVLANVSHENEIARAELSLVLPSRTEQTTGVHVLIHVLWEAAGKRASAQTSPQDKWIFDTLVFTLSTLTNIYNCEATMDILKRTLVGDSIDFVTWLVRWALELTTTFRVAIVESTFGHSPSKHRDRRLSAAEEDNLVLAGNSFVLLGRLIVKDAATDESSCSLYTRVMTELPGADDTIKFTLFKNTLLAFMSFYLHKVGPMSAAVIVAVRNLIRRLEELHKRKNDVLLLEENQTSMEQQREGASICSG